MASAVFEKTVAVRLDMPEKVHKLLRMVAASEGKSMAAYCRDVIVQNVTDKARQKRIKP